MPVDFKAINAKAEEKLPEILPKAVKWLLVHLLMLLYHFRMPIWVTAVKASKMVRKCVLGKQRQNTCRRVLHKTQL